MRAGSRTARGSRSGGCRPTSARRRRARPSPWTGWTACWCPGGFGVRGIEGKIGAIRHARTRGVPVLGLCLGLQCMVIETARHLAGLEGANSTEFDPDAAHPVISTMAEQVDVVAGERDMGGTMRLGAYPALLAEGSIVARAYGTREVSERHRHRYEVNNAYRDRLTDAGLVICGTLARRLARRVRRAARRRAPVLRRDPGAPRAQEPPDPAAPAVRGVRPGGDRLPRRRPAAGGAAARTHGVTVGGRRRERAGDGAAAPRLRGRRLRRHLHGQGHGGAPRPGPDARRRHRRPRDHGAPRGGGDRRAGRRRPAGDDLPVPARAGAAAVGDARRAAGRRGGGPGRRPRAASWPRRSGWPRGSGRR